MNRFRSRWGTRLPSAAPATPPGPAAEPPSVPGRSSLSLTGVQVRYGQTMAVDEVDLRLSDGQVLALLGPSGCGKSSLLRAVAGLEPLSAGEIRWEGVDLARVPVHRRGFGLMFQDGVLFAHRDVAGNIAYGLRREGLSRNQIRDRVNELLELVGLPGYGDRQVNTLSGGQAQRVALARSLAPRPRLLLLDEPLAALDTSLRERLLTDLRSVLTRTGTTAVFVTHDQDEAYAVSDLVAVMKAGRIRQSGPTAQVWRSPADPWVAEFLGYSTLVPAGSWAELTAEPAGHDGVVALRPTALTVDPSGDLIGTVIEVLPGPDRTALRVELDLVGPVAATAATDHPPELGDKVTLRLDPAALVRLPEFGSP